MPLITVFTPTYNRAGKLHRVFNSLSNQSFKDFEWVIVDDGSQDETKNVVNQFIQQAPEFKIHYFFQTNAGKHIAINQGLMLAKGEWFHIADSDDEIEPQTLSVFMDTWNGIPDNRKNEFCGIVACCKDQFGNRISDIVPGGIFDGHIKPLFYKYKFRKEFFHIYKTAVMRQFPFPDYIFNTYIPESVIWRRMTEKLKVRVISNELRIYYINEEQEGLMNRKGKSPQSRALANCIESANVLNYDLSYFIYYTLYFLKMAMLYYSFKPFLDKQQAQWIRLRPKAKIFACMFFFAGKIYNIILKRNYQKQLRKYDT